MCRLYGLYQDPDLPIALSQGQTASGLIIHMLEIQLEALKTWTKHTWMMLMTPLAMGDNVGFHIVL